MSLIEALAREADSAVSDLIGDDKWDDFVSLPPVERIQWRYCHADCDDFALVLHEITGYPIVGLSHPSKGPIHRLVEAPDGRFIDAKGYVSIDDLKRRYRLKSLQVYINAGGCATINSDDEIADIIRAMLHFPEDPFQGVEFRAQVATYVATALMIDDVLPQAAEACQNNL